MILVTGGAGYIGSHTSVELLAAGYDLVVLDNLSNSSSESLERVKKISKKSLRFIKGDIRDRDLLRSVFERFEIDAVIHFAGLKAVGESVANPLRYYNNNVSGSLSLFEVMADFGCKRLVFSSSATVYGDPASVPIKEDFPLLTTNPYGGSKLMVENILRDLFTSDQDWSISLLRYFNPVGAHESGLIGEDPHGIPNNLMPFVSQVAMGLLEKLSVFGGDYNTVDGTGVRDYIHVVDLAKGHVAALRKLSESPYSGGYNGLLTFNLGTGRGYSVLEVLKAFEKASGERVPYEIVARRPGDVEQCYADPTYAFKMLNWKAELDLNRMCEDAWRWQLKNPRGYNK
ncbi:UDP-glucose 4-epimerase GalE [Aliidiomarina sanyensis]|uniref:UDP-glucose 4-epimerase n=1 Tax=Aliidiomarina sanyensis TaxID=1249555 RepID=A0A432WB58_9GAMM|nr:UDP-glucose 4-epimerase GalE [Aliidiomarina sanyensis]RUO27869.1 UDP-glucose 4-epimerase GalE [Aliidiomarina sanyensis]